jgi:aminoglycoside phosphotransferase (APT) family kinase protein
MGENTDPLIDATRLRRWMRGAVPQFPGAFTVQRIGEGQSCLTFTLSNDHWTIVLRRPPRGLLPQSAFDVLREYRIMRALCEHAPWVPLASAYAASDDLSVIGAPFYLMEFVAGQVLRSTIPPRTSRASLGDLGRELVDTLISIHEIDPAKVGLGTLAPERGYVERQLHRMQHQWDRVRVREIPDVDLLGQWLRDHVPAEGKTTLIHGDYKLDNVILDLPGSGAIRAVIDWELATLGDPLADLGWLLYFWRDAGEPHFTLPVCAVTDAEGLPRRRDITEHYANAIGADLADINWYIALAGWKISIIMEGSYQRFQSGIADHAAFGSLEQGVPAMALRARQLLESL